MDSAHGVRFLVEMLNTNKHVGDKPILSTAVMPLEQAQAYLLKNAKTSESRSQFFTQQELELFAVNPPLEPGHKNLANVFVKGLDGKTFVSTTSIPMQLSCTFTD